MRKHVRSAGAPLACAFTAVLLPDLRGLLAQLVKISVPLCAVSMEVPVSLVEVCSKV